ncbi:hypothetical protein E5676_scaffold596G00100 [Cucumis melo var. makuwa]|uniref:Uncharacterized protein n=1 Tax=Cucumis melo var. makuwa TaxID=1194695 RepID=A0A5D3BMW1_CUCMM|nr:hypothetical protein E5676_scaffold596G00100 [Cucumis melo var. makuwa]
MPNGHPIVDLWNYLIMISSSYKSLDRKTLLDRISLHVEEFVGFDGFGSSFIRETSMSHELWTPQVNSCWKLNLYASWSDHDHASGIGWLVHASIKISHSFWL